jgi:hypothetical protein
MNTTSGPKNYVGQTNPKPKTDYVREGIDDAGAVNTGVSLASNAPMILGTMNNIANNASTLRTLADVGNQVASAGKVAGGVSAAAGAVGTGLSAVSLGKDIYDALDKGKVTFDNAMHFADDGTALVAGTLGLAEPGIGSAIGLGLTVGEKIVTGAIKAAKAVKEEKKREGVDHLKPAVWFDTVGKAIFPDWMFKELGKTKEQKAADKAKKEAKKAENKAKREAKKADRKAKFNAWKANVKKKRDEKKKNKR